MPGMAWHGLVWSDALQLLAAAAAAAAADEAWFC